MVGVIGKGHMNGVIYALISDQGNLRFRDLVGQNPNNGWFNDLLKSLVRDTLIGFLLWALYEQIRDGTWLNSSFIFDLLSDPKI